jgi:hypothetical protein
MEIARSDLVIAVLPGDYGKRRPALLVQADAFNPTHASVEARRGQLFSKPSHRLNGKVKYLPPSISFRH